MTFSLMVALPAPARAASVDPTFGGLRTIDFTQPSGDVATAINHDEGHGRFG